MLSRIRIAKTQFVKVLPTRQRFLSPTVPQEERRPRSNSLEWEEVSDQVESSKSNQQ